MVVAVWSGSSKPSDLNAYLEPFVAEVKTLSRDGIGINGFHISIVIRAFICDTPARSFIKGNFRCFRRVLSTLLWSLSFNLFESKLNYSYYHIHVQAL